MPQSSSAYPVVFASLILAMIMRILPIPHELAMFNPDWVLLCLIYWNMAIPERVGVGTAWFAGLMVDVLTGRLMGQHALVYSLTAYFCVRLHRRLRLYPLSQQAMTVLGLLLSGQVLMFWTQSVKATGNIDARYWLPSLIGTLFWPFLFVTLRRVRRYFNIY